MNENVCKINEFSEGVQAGERGAGERYMALTNGKESGSEGVKLKRA